MSTKKSKKQLEQERQRARHRKKVAENKSASIRFDLELDQERDAYAQRWNTVDAAHYELKGYYAWMASFVAAWPLVVEIGCGDGRSTIELAKRGHRVIGIDENPACIRLAENNLRAAGIDVQVIDREMVNPLAPRLYEISYSPPTVAVPSSGVLLMTGDVLSDPKLEEWLVANGPFDAVVCWLIGTHDARLGNNVAVVHKNVRSSGEYRLRVQNTTYEIADRILRPEGVLHIVDRGEAPSDAMKDKFIDETVNSHREQATVTSLQVSAPDVAFHPFDLPPSASGQQMIKTLGSSGRDSDELKLALVSTLARKR